MTPLEELNRQIAQCQECDLAKTRNNVVPGEGAEDAPIMLIGEAPGFYEDQQGRPFVGAAGRFLDELLKSIGFDRSMVYICNVIKCRPPENRDPMPKEIETCRKWLDRQIEIIAPEIIVTLGRHSLAKFLKGASISKVHGTPYNIDGRVCFPLYHPAAALHQQNLRKTIEADFLKLPEVLAQAKSASGGQAEPEPKQLSMF
ncbi:MAG: uracil-DNA glycosylase family protein [Dehalococcoidia bacterium]